MKSLICLSILILGLSVQAFASIEGDLGFFQTKYASNPFYYFDKQPDLDSLEDFIARNRQKSSSTLSDRDLGEKIKIVSDCFQVDTNIITGIITQESRFNQFATSETGAVGLMQLTTVAINEVDQQLGRDGVKDSKHRAIVNEVTVNYLKKTINECISPKLLNGAKWVNLWERSKVKDSHGRRIKSKINKELKNDANTNIVYGVINLKLLLAIYKQKDLKAKDTAIFKSAIAEYNGEETLSAGIKKKYQYRNLVLDFAQELNQSIR